MAKVLKDDEAFIWILNIINNNAWCVGEINDIEIEIKKSVKTVFF